MRSVQKVRPHRLLALLCVLFAGCSGHRVDLSVQAPATLDREPPGFEQAVVERVVDGDTIVVRITGRVDGPGAGNAEIGASHSVRLTGIDTPESVDPRRAVECFGHEASAATAALLEGREITMVVDVEESDQYDRLLRYIYIGSEMANARLVVNGYAHVYTYPPNVRHADLLVQLGRDAREGDRGLWSLDTCDEVV
jgi:micrococcal nuclease